jgi:hypothetical protein
MLISRNNRQNSGIGVKDLSIAGKLSQKLAENQSIRAERSHPIAKADLLLNLDTLCISKEMIE